MDGADDGASRSGGDAAACRHLARASDIDGELGVHLGDQLGEALGLELGLALAGLLDGLGHVFLAGGENQGALVQQREITVFPLSDLVSLDLADLDLFEIGEFFGKLLGLGG